MDKKGFLQRLTAGETILVAEGYMWEFDRRGYLNRGHNAPEVVMEHPDLVKAMHHEFVHAGSDVVLAFTYCAHRERLKSINKEDYVEKLNRQALRIAKEVAEETGALLAGGICHTRVYDENDPVAVEKCRQMFKEMVEWAVEAGVDYITGETFDIVSEALLALECIQKYGKGVPAVITFASYCPDETVDGVPIPEACRRLEEAGAAVVGLNCARGPKTMIPLLKEIRKTCKGPIAALPVPFQCRDDCRTFYSIKDKESGDYLYPRNLESARCGAKDVIEFAKEAQEIGVQYLGLCCGNTAAYMRDLAETLGRRPPASKYSMDMSKSYIQTSNSDKINVMAKKTRLYMYGTDYMVQ
ncbi:betaine--homocysteine S-methyltransferase 1-like [Saccostrea echinata]|uniref:betaine--homocysteine S-methyltransferase 1-like n=1 Tax=Saccostrea echinata TaxID=191078 RepID=UPI002A7F1503|nr:betaine--homocysteine S-methyltransferase 1-like [Saccostrea echinata]